MIIVNFFILLYSLEYDLIFNSLFLMNLLKMYEDYIYLH